MEIIAHRGFWLSLEERNQLPAFERAVSAGIGTETDFRDYNGKLVISHNVADSSCMDADVFFAMYKGTERTLALNIKADGIQELLKKLIDKHKIQNYFCFDMSVPDTLLYPEFNLTYFVRQSEYEVINDLYKDSAGVWLDGFISDDWITPQLIYDHRKNDKKVCIVSSDLHKRDYMELWKRIKTDSILNDCSVILCTDYPDKAKEYFYGKD